MLTRFRQANTRDTDAIVALIQAYYAYDHIPFDEARIRRGLADLATHPGLGSAWLILHDDQIAGYFLLTYGFDLEFGGRQATVTELYIRPQHRRLGLGRAALCQVETILRAQGIDSYELQVESDNHEALAFYVTLGFERYDRVPMSKRVGVALPATSEPLRGPDRPVGLVQSYDRLAESYAANLLHELDGKPLDRALLQNLIVEAEGPILEVGGGPGQIARFLADHGADVRGSDLSPNMVALAQRLHPHLQFQVADLRALPFPPESLAAIVAFYVIVHTPPGDLAAVFSAMRPALRPGGLLLISFHIGDETLHASELFGQPVDLDFQFHDVQTVQSALSDAGFELRATTIRAPYPTGEHPSTRAYILARRASAPSEGPT